MNIKNLNLFLFTIGFVEGIIYIIIINMGYPTIFMYLIKPIPIWYIAYYTWKHEKKVLTLGLFLGSLGDIFIIADL